MNSALAILSLLLVPMTSAASAAATMVSAPPPQLALDPFYRKYVDAAGIPVVGSDRVPDAALIAAANVVQEELAQRPDLRAAIAARSTRISIIAEDESIIDIPEQSALAKPGPDDPRLTLCERKRYDRLVAPFSARDYWSGRARGLGGNNPIGAAENLLGLSGTMNFGENILAHEFAHVILDAIQTSDPRLYARIERAFSKAIGKGRWKGDYASVSVQEYWAEGTQYWFNTNMIARLQDANVRSSEDLRRYDPELFRLLGKVYGASHRIPLDPFYRHPAQVNIPEGWQSSDCA